MNVSAYMRVCVCAWVHACMCVHMRACVWSQMARPFSVEVENGLVTLP